MYEHIVCRLWGDTSGGLAVRTQEVVGRFSSSRDLHKPYFSTMKSDTGN